MVPCDRNGLADVCHRKVAELAEALADDALKTQAAMALPVLFSEMPQIPADGQQMIVLEKRCRSWPLGQEPKRAPRCCYRHGRERGVYA